MLCCCNSHHCTVNKQVLNTNVWALHQEHSCEQDCLAQVEWSLRERERHWQVIWGATGATINVPQRRGGATLVSHQECCFKDGTDRRMSTKGSEREKSKQWITLQLCSFTTNSWKRDFQGPNQSPTTSEVIKLSLYFLARQKKIFMFNL